MSAPEFDSAVERQRLPRVIVAHPGTQHSYATALALQHAGLLYRYVTSFYFKTPSFLSHLLQLMPQSFRRRAQRELLRRRTETLDQSRIQTYPMIEMARVLATRLGQSALAGKAIRWRNRAFDGNVAQLVRKLKPDAVICYDSCAIEAFRACRQIGALSMLDQTTGHVRTAMRIMREEAELHPEFADSISLDTPDWQIEQCSAEALAADVVLAASDYVRATLIENSIPAAKIVIVPYGADTARFSPPAVRDHEILRVLYVGGLSQRKGIKYLLDAFKRLNLQNAELVMVGGIVGSGSALTLYKDHFRHVPHVPHQEIHSIYQSADIFVYPSLHEGSSLAVMEAMASGLPVIATTNSGTIIRDGEDGYIIPIRSTEAIMEKILLLYQNSVLRKEIGRRARQAAEAHSWQSYEQRLSQLIRNRIIQVQT